MAEHVLDVLKIEHDIMDAMPFKSKYLRIVPSIYGFEPKSTCPLVPTIHPLHVLGNPVDTIFWKRVEGTDRCQRRKPRWIGVPMGQKEHRDDGVKLG